MTGGGSNGRTGPDVFVSYSRNDRDAARRLIDFLEQSGFSVWWDGMLEAGTVYTRTTEDALEHARAVVVVWSARSVESHWVRDEAQSGRDRGNLIPVSIDGSLPPLGFRQFQSVDLSDWDGHGEASSARNVRDAVARLVDPDNPVAPAPPAPNAPPAPAPTARSRTVWIAAAFGALLIAAIAVWQLQDAPAPTEANSLAILPFDNLSDDREQSYFSTGLAEEMRQFLTQQSNLQVVAQASTRAAAEKGGEAQAIATDLGVRYLLDGSVRRSQDKVRVSVHLIDGTNGFDIWSQAYDRSLDDIFAVQSDIARKVASALKARIQASGRGSAARVGGTENAAAYDAYLRGITLYDLALDESSDRAAQTQFEAAVRADPSYGAAWAALSRVQTTIANSYSNDRPTSEIYDAAIASARKAIAVAPDLPAGHAALGYVLLNGRLDVAAARQPYQTAYKRGARDADILQAYATYMGRVGEFDASLAANDRAVALDPLNAVIQRQRAQVLYAAGDLAGARTAINKALKLNPEMSVASRILADISYLEGDYRTALRLYEDEGSDLSRFTGLALARFKLGDTAGADAAMAQLRARFGDNGLYQQAQILAQWGRKADALKALEQAFAAGDSGLVLLRNDPLLKPVRSDPRFKRILSRLGFN